MVFYVKNLDHQFALPWASTLPLVGHSYHIPRLKPCRFSKRKASSVSIFFTVRSDEALVG